MPVWLLDDALALARKGFKVFPLTPKTKRPSTPTGCVDASTDEATVRARWGTSLAAARNIGVACQNVFVLDVDVKKLDGFRDLKDMEERFGSLPKRFAVKTPSGGRHYYFKRPKEPMVGRVGVPLDGRPTAVDVRVGNQYVVAPPSVLPEGAYEWIGEPPESVDDLPELPRAWIDFLPKREKREPIASSARTDYFATSELELNDAERRCRAYMKRVDPAVMNSSGQRQFFVACNVIFNGFSLSEDAGWPILMEYNSRCLPPWDMNDPKEAAWVRYAARRAISTALEKGKLLEAKPERKKALPKIDSDVKIFPEFADFDEKQETAAPKASPSDVWESPVDARTEDEDNEGTIDPKFLAIPGFVDLCMENMRRAATVFNQASCFFGALSLLSTLMGPKFCCHGLYANLYLVSLAGSGSGKDVPRSFNQLVLESVGLGEVVGRSFVSGEALEDAILSCPVKLFQADECDFLFKTMSQGKESFQRSMQSNMLELYTSASKTWTRRNNASLRNDSQKKVCYNPYFNFFGVAPPRHYYEALSARLAEGGLFGRFLIIKSRRSELFPEQCGVSKDVLDPRVVETAKWFRDYSVIPEQNDALAGRFAPYIPFHIPISPSAQEALSAFNRRAYELGQTTDEEAKRSVFSRATEKVYKLATLYETSRKWDQLLQTRVDDKIDLDAVNNILIVDDEAAGWAIAIVKEIINVQLGDLEKYFFENQHEKNLNFILELIRKGVARNRTRLLTRSTLYRQAQHLSTTDVDKLLNDLKEQRRIRYVARQDSVGRTHEGWTTD